MTDLSVTLRPSATRTDRYNALWKAELKRWELTTDYYTIKVWPEDEDIESNIHSYDQSYTAKAKRVRDALVEAATEQVAPA